MSEKSTRIKDLLKKDCRNKFGRTIRRGCSVLLAVALVAGVAPQACFNVNAQEMEIVSSHAPEDAVEAFVNRAYELLLGRDPAKDPTGVQYWTNVLKANEKDGQPFGGTRFVQYFIVGESGKEYTSKKKNNEEFLLDMYTVLMGRDRNTVRTLDSKGFAYWLERLDSGEGRELIMKSMANCEEFKKLCSDAGIQVGDFAYYMNASKYHVVAQFVARLYKYCMGREFDAEGLEYWVSSLKNGSQSINSMCTFFYNCDEFVKMNLTVDEKVNRLYRTFFGREADAEGKAFWVDSLNNKTQTWVSTYTYFIGSKEFAGIKAKFGL